MSDLDQSTTNAKPKTLEDVTGKTTKEEHASDETKAEDPNTVAESRAEKGIKPSATEDHAPQKGQEKEADKVEDKSDEPTEKEIEESTEQAIVRHARILNTGRSRLKSDNH